MHRTGGLWHAIASLFDLGGAAGLHTFPVRDLGQLLRILYMVNGDKVVIEGISKIDLELPTNSKPAPLEFRHRREYLGNTECRITRPALQMDHGQQPHRSVTGLPRNRPRKRMWSRQVFSIVRTARIGKGTP